jgi:hypothetical protein
MFENSTKISRCLAVVHDNKGFNKNYNKIKCCIGISIFNEKSYKIEFQNILTKKM